MGKKRRNNQMTETTKERPAWLKEYRVIRADRAADKSIKVGDIVYDSKGHDYGCANDDTRMTGIEHQSVTLDDCGDYPFFTIPKMDLEVIGS
jgi:hypothetical protein